MCKTICKVLYLYLQIIVIFPQYILQLLSAIFGPKSGVIPAEVRPNVRWKWPNRSGSAEPRFLPFGRTLTKIQNQTILRLESKNMNLVRIIF